MNNKNKNSGFIKNSFLWVIMVIIAVVGFQYFFKGVGNETVDKISYTTLVKKLEAGDIKEFSYQPSSSLISVSGEYKKAEKVKAKTNFSLIANKPAEVKRFTSLILPTDTTISELQKIADKEKVKVSVKPEASNGVWLTLLGSWLPLLLMIGFLYMMMGGMRGGGANGGGNPMSFGKSRAKEQDKKTVKVRFADVAGADEEKQELVEVVDFLKNPKKYHDLGARIPAGVLLEGPPGTGKTLLAKAVAGEAAVPFFSISGSDFVEMFVGVGASRVRDLFDQAKKNSPCIIFIDEIDAVGRQRGTGLGGGHDEREQTLNQLLVEMDGFAINEGVIVMAATNRRDILDPALLRPGRFDRQVTVNYPDQAGRIAILKVHSKGKKLAADVDLDNIAKRMPFSTGAELENVMNEAAILAARGRKTEIDQQLLVDAIARVQMGPEKRSHKVNEKDKRLVATHESGHALVGHLLPGCDEVHLITIVPRGQAAGHTLSLPAEEHDNMSRSQMMDQVCMCLGGHAAEQVVLGEIYTGSSSDLKRATELCRRMVTMYGMSDEVGTMYLANDQEVFVGMEFGQSRDYSEEVAAQIDREVKRLLAECYAKAVKLLEDHRKEMDNVVNALLAEDTLSRKEFVALMNGEKLPAGGDDQGKPQPTPEIPPREEKPAPEKPPIPDGVIPGMGK